MSSLLTIVTAFLILFNALLIGLLINGMTVAFLEKWVRSLSYNQRFFYIFTSIIISIIIFLFTNYLQNSFFISTQGKIIYPINKQKVSSKINAAKGTIKNLKENENLWIIQNDRGDSKYYFVPVTEKNNEWNSIDIYFGENQEGANSGQQYSLFLVAVDKQKSSLIENFRDKEKLEEDYGATKAEIPIEIDFDNSLDRVTVTR